MNIIDYLLIAVLLVSILVGAMRGFLREAVSLVTWIVAFFLAWQFAGTLEPHLGDWLGQYPQARTWVARGLVFLIVLLIGTAVAGILGHFVRLSIFSGLDRFLGMLFGALRGLVVLGLLVIFGQLLRLDSEDWWRKSVLIPSATSVAGGLRALVGEHWPPEEISV
jgi:membrane protein required for colicin V production